MGLRLVRGRFFTAAENRPDAPPVIVVNEALAKRYFPNEDPIGKHLTFGISHDFGPAPGDSVRSRGEIVGIAHDVRNNSLEDKPEPAAYFPYSTLPLAATFIVRTMMDPSVVEREIRRQVAAVDRNQPIYGLGLLDDALGDSVARPRFYMMLLTVFAGLALFLAALGTYGVVAYAAQQRTREFGVRIALGASRSSIARLVVRRAILLAIGGVGAGAVIAGIATRALQGLLFGVEAVDKLTFVIVALVLGGIASLAAWLPARRAAHVDPLVAMRAD
jgi:putative ABC transport system permease protein